METADLADHDFVFQVARDLDIADRDLAAQIADYIVGYGYGGQITAIRDLLDEKPDRKSISTAKIREILDSGDDL